MSEVRDAAIFEAELCWRRTELERLASGGDRGNTARTSVELEPSGHGAGAGPGAGPENEQTKVETVDILNSRPYRVRTHGTVE